MSSERAPSSAQPLSLLDSLERLVLLVEDERGDPRDKHRGNEVDDPVDLFQQRAKKKSGSAKV